VLPENIFKFDLIKELGTASDRARKGFAWICSQIFAEPSGRAPSEGREMTFLLKLLHTFEKIHFKMELK